MNDLTKIVKDLIDQGFELIIDDSTKPNSPLTFDKNDINTYVEININDREYSGYETAMVVYNSDVIYDQVEFKDWFGIRDMLLKVINNKIISKQDHINDLQMNIKNLNTDLNIVENKMTNFYESY